MRRRCCCGVGVGCLCGSRSSIIERSYYLLNEERPKLLTRRAPSEKLRSTELSSTALPTELKFGDDCTGLRRIFLSYSSCCNEAVLWYRSGEATDFMRRDNDLLMSRNRGTFKLSSDKTTRYSNYWKSFNKLGGGGFRTRNLHLY